MAAGTVPAHVPAHLVRDFNYLDSSAYTDAYQFFGRLHDGPDIFYTPCNFGHWVATRHADIEYILEHTSDFCSEAHTVPKEGKPFSLPLVEYDGPVHTDFRRLLGPFFTPTAVIELQARAREYTLSLIDGFYAKGECDFVTEFASKMPISIVMGLAGLPAEDRPYLLTLSQSLVHGASEERKETFAKVFDYFKTQIIPARRKAPGADLISALLSGTVDGGRPVSDMEVLGMGALLVGAGLDTVANMLAFFAKFLAENRLHRQQLIDDPSLIPPAQDELVRRFHVANIARMVRHDLDYKGLHFKQGELILLPTPLAGIDDRRYANPLSVDFSRTDKRNLAFGRGPHQCIGAFLGRAELRVFLGEWLRRIPHFEIKADASIISRTGRTLSIASLPIVWQPV